MAGVVKLGICMIDTTVFCSPFQRLFPDLKDRFESQQTLRILSGYGSLLGVPFSITTDFVLHLYMFIRVLFFKRRPANLAKSAQRAVRRLLHARFSL